MLCISLQTKVCGTVGKPKLLAIHGWLDNSNSFDTIVPLLPLNKFNLLAIDLPGHGRSSHRPAGTYYPVQDWIIDIRRIINHVGWTNYSIIGHSLGAAVTMQYAAFYSNEVNKIIVLDFIRSLTQPFVDVNDGVNFIDKLFEYERQLNKPSKGYSKEEAVEMMVKSLNGSCSPKSAEILLQRGARVNEMGKLVFTRDPRTKLHSFIELHSDQLDVFANSLKCHVLIIKASDSDLSKWYSKEELEKTLRIYKKVAKSFEMVFVEGTHHVHLNYPERVAPHIIRFLDL
ncbi:Serine hydrolase-like protein 2 [Chamberlinius hualienensis]